MSLTEIWNVSSTANQHQMFLANFFWFYVFKHSEGHKTAQVPLRHHCAWVGLSVSEAMKCKNHKARYYAFTTKGICRIINSDRHSFLGNRPCGVDLKWSSSSTLRYNRNCSGTKLSMMLCLAASQMHTEGPSQSYFFLFYVAAFQIMALEQLWKRNIQIKLKLYQISTYHSVNRKQLVPPFESSMPFRHSSRDDARNINRWILFLSSHDIKAQAFISLWQLHHSWVWMAFTCSKSSHCCLEEKEERFGYVGRTLTCTLLFICRKN